MEDDLDKTARLLKRVPDFDLVQRKIQEGRNASDSRVFEEYGWTQAEYYRELGKYLDEKSLRNKNGR